MRVVVERKLFAGQKLDVAELELMQPPDDAAEQQVAVAVPVAAQLSF